MSLPLQLTTLLHGNCIKASNADISNENPDPEDEAGTPIIQVISDVKTNEDVSVVERTASSEVKSPGTCNEIFNNYFSIFFNIFIFFLAIYPYVWLLLDRRFARKTCGICSRMIRSRDQN